MRKFLSVFTIALLLLNFTACDNQEEPTVSDTPEAAVSQAAAASEEETASDTAVSENKILPNVEPTEADDLGDYYVKILDSKQNTDYNGNKAIIISFEYTNNGPERETFATTIFPVAAQDGEELETAYIVGSPDNNIDAYIEEIEPGETITVDVAFILISDSPVEVNVTGSFYSGETNVSKTFTLE